MSLWPAAANARPAWQPLTEPRRQFAEERFRLVQQTPMSINHLLSSSHQYGQLFSDWVRCTGLSALEGSHFSVSLHDPLGHLFAWLCQEQAPLPARIELARDFFNVRSVSAQQIKIVEAIWHAFLLGFNSWSAWDYIGRQTRTAIDVGVLETWR